MNRSDSIKMLAAALCKAQGEFQHAKKEDDNPFFKSKYASLASCIDAAKGPLSANGLSVSQIIDISEGGALVLETILMHSSGEFISGRSYLNPVKSDPQSLGSVCTYFRRYAFSAITGIAADDDDGNQASQAGAVQNHPGVPGPVRPLTGGKETVKGARNFKAEIDDCVTINKLTEVWGRIPIQVKPDYEMAKNTRKKFILEGEEADKDVQNYPSTTTNNSEES